LTSIVTVSIQDKIQLNSLLYYTELGGMRGMSQNYTYKCSVYSYGTCIKPYIEFIRHVIELPYSSLKRPPYTQLAA